MSDVKRVKAMDSVISKGKGINQHRDRIASTVSSTFTVGSTSVAAAYPHTTMAALTSQISTLASTEWGLNLLSSHYKASSTPPIRHMV